MGWSGTWPRLIGTATRRGLHGPIFSLVLLRWTHERITQVRLLGAGQGIGGRQWRHIGCDHCLRQFSILFSVSSCLGDAGAWRGERLRHIFRFYAHPSRALSFTELVTILRDSLRAGAREQSRGGVHHANMTARLDDGDDEDSIRRHVRPQWCRPRIWTC